MVMNSNAKAVAGGASGGLAFNAVAQNNFDARNVSPHMMHNPSKSLKLTGTSDNNKKRQQKTIKSTDMTAGRENTSAAIASGGALHFS